MTFRIWNIVWDGDPYFLIPTHLRSIASSTHDRNHKYKKKNTKILRDSADQPQPTSTGHKYETTIKGGITHGL